MNESIKNYNKNLPKEFQEIAEHLAEIISKKLVDSESKIWHSHPVWFLNGNPIVGYSKQKPGLRLMFWSGADFNEDILIVREGKFKDASIFFTNISQINSDALNRCLEKSVLIQWDYKNIVKRKGQLERIT
jgi:hypothetical protein